MSSRQNARPYPAATQYERPYPAATPAAHLLYLLLQHFALLPRLLLPLPPSLAEALLRQTILLACSSQLGRHDLGVHVRLRGKHGVVELPSGFCCQRHMLVGKG